MLKDFGILLGGVFVGAVTAEIVRKKCPNIGNKLSNKIHSVATGIKEAFKAGYEHATQSNHAAKVAAKSVSD